MPTPAGAAPRCRRRSPRCSQAARRSSRCAALRAAARHRRRSWPERAALDGRRRAAAAAARDALAPRTQRAGAAARRTRRPLRRRRRRPRGAAAARLQAPAPSFRHRLLRSAPRAAHPECVARPSARSSSSSRLWSSEATPSSALAACELLLQLIFPLRWVSVRTTPPPPPPAASSPPPTHRHPPTAARSTCRRSGRLATRRARRLASRPASTSAARPGPAARVWRYSTRMLRHAHAVGAAADAAAARGERPHRTAPRGAANATGQVAPPDCRHDGCRPPSPTAATASARFRGSRRAWRGSSALPSSRPRDLHLHVLDPARTLTATAATAVTVAAGRRGRGQRRRRRRRLVGRAARGFVDAQPEGRAASCGKAPAPLLCSWSPPPTAAGWRAGAAAILPAAPRRYLRSSWREAAERREELEQLAALLPLPPAFVAATPMHASAGVGGAAAIEDATARDACWRAPPYVYDRAPASCRCRSAPHSCRFPRRRRRAAVAARRARRVGGRAAELERGDE